MAYDSFHGTSLLFGGLASGYNAETWEYFSDCNRNFAPDWSEISVGTSTDCNANLRPDECDMADCLPGQPVCADCNANGALDECDLATGDSYDFNDDGQPDECYPDCQSNGYPDFFDIAFGHSEDCNINDVPDECELFTGDCNGNGVPDECDIAAGTSYDFNDDGQPDECYADCQPNGYPDFVDIAFGLSEDCNVNDIPDECEEDCNANGLADGCDVASGASLDCDANGVPDECDVALLDCNANGVPDSCDVANDSSADCDGNGIPDECEVIVVNSLEDPGVPNDGLTTFREAMIEANLHCGVTITFDSALVGGAIQPVSQLPAIVGGSIIVDGDLDDDCAPDILLDGSLAGSAHGIVLTSANNRIDGLAISGFQLNGVNAVGAGVEANVLTCCYVGTDLIGSSPLGNGLGILIGGGASNNRVGPGTLISGNAGNGIMMEGAGTSGNTVLGSTIGTAVDRLVVLGNGVDGIGIHNASTGNIVGPNNVIAGARYNQVAIAGPGTTGNTVFRNIIGVEIVGPWITDDGVDIRDGAAGNTIGPENIVAHNGANGIVVRRSDTSNNIIIGNDIRQNSARGVYFFAASGTSLIDNSITANGDSGILVWMTPDELPAPVFRNVTSDSVSGLVSAPDGSIVEIFSDPDYEGAVRLGETIAFGGEFTYNHGVMLPTIGTLTATVRGPAGGISRFGWQCASSPRMHVVRQARVTNVAQDSKHAFFWFPDWSNDGSTIIMSAKRPPGDWFYERNDLAIVSATGGDLLTTAVAADSDNSGYIRPRFRPGFSDRIAFESIGGVCWEDTVRTASIYGEDSLCLAPAFGNQHWASWSPDGISLTFFSPQGALRQSYIVQNDGTGLRALAPGVSVTSFFPNGTSLLGYDDDGLWQLDLNGERISSVLSFGFAGIPSPNGTLITFGNGEWVWLTNASGAWAFPIVPGEEPRWSPDGRSLVYYWHQDIWTIEIAPNRSDSDEDGDVDLDDYGFFQSCLAASGPGVAISSDACLTTFDLDGDGDIDLRDYGAFQVTFTGDGPVSTCLPQRAVARPPRVLPRNLPGASASVNPLE